MVEYGIVKVFFGSQSQNQGRYGFMRVTDEMGKRTGEEVFFHLGNAREVLDTTARYSTTPFICFGARIKAQEPRRGDRVVFQRPATGRQNRATKWNYRRVWDDIEAKANKNADIIRQQLEEEVGVLRADHFPDYDPRDEEGSPCDGCGEYSCVCAELASFAAHQSDPETRGSWWTP